MLARALLRSPKSARVSKVQQSSRRGSQAAAVLYAAVVFRFRLVRRFRGLLMPKVRLNPDSCISAALCARRFLEPIAPAR